MKDQPDSHRGPQIMNYLEVAEDEYVDEATMNALGEQIRQTLTAMIIKE
jgi:hypothetical protein